MFEEIKDYQGRDLNTAFPPDHRKGSLRPIRFYLYFQRKNVT